MSNETLLDLTALKKKVASSVMHAKKMELVISSLSRANIYSMYHWNQYINTSDVKDFGDLLKWGFNRDDDGFSDKFKCEAHITAYLHNVHIICDQFPFALKSSILTQLKKGNKNLEDKDCAWSEDFLKSIEAIPNSATLIQKMRAFLKNDDFINLKNIINTTKHRYINEIQFKNENLLIITHSFDDVEEISVCEQNSATLMKRMYNILIPKIFELYEESKKL